MVPLQYTYESMQGMKHKRHDWGGLIPGEKYEQEFEKISVLRVVA